MNLKEYLFYSRTPISKMAEAIDLAPSYLRGILNHHYPLSAKVKRQVYKYTHGIVKPENVLCEPSHPEYKKILKIKGK